MTKVHRQHYIISRGCEKILLPRPCSLKSFWWIWKTGERKRIIYIFVLMSKLLICLDCYIPFDQRNCLTCLWSAAQQGFKTRLQVDWYACCARLLLRTDDWQYSAASVETVSLNPNHWTLLSTCCGAAKHLAVGSPVFDAQVCEASRRSC